MLQWRPLMFWGLCFHLPAYEAVPDHGHDKHCLIVVYSIITIIASYIEMANRGSEMEGEWLTQDQHSCILHRQWSGLCIDVAREMHSPGTCADSLIRYYSLSISVNMRPSANKNPQGSKKMWLAERWKAIELSETYRQGFGKEITVQFTWKHKRTTARGGPSSKLLRHHFDFILRFEVPSVLCKRNCIDFYNHLCTSRQLYDRTRGYQMIRRAQRPHGTKQNWKIREIPKFPINIRFLVWRVGCLLVSRAWNLLKIWMICFTKLVIVLLKARGSEKKKLCFDAPCSSRFIDKQDCYCAWYLLTPATRTVQIITGT